MYPNFDDANQKLYTIFVNPEPSKKKKMKRKSQAEQRKIYQELLDSEEVKIKLKLLENLVLVGLGLRKVGRPCQRPGSSGRGIR